MPLLLGNTAASGSFSYVPSGITTTGLVFYGDVGITQSYPGSGSTWFDLSGLENNLTLTNTSYVNAGTGGHASYFNFDGGPNSSYAMTTGRSSLNFGTGVYSVTVIMFGNSSMNSDTYYHDLIQFGYDYDGSTFRSALWRSGLRPGELYSVNGGATGFGTGIGSGYWDPTSAFTVTSQFTHITYVRGATTTAIYRNGQPYGTHANDGSFSNGGAQGIWIGGRPGGDGNRSWYGSIYAAAIWKDKALSDSEVLGNWNAVKARYGY